MSLRIFGSGLLQNSDVPNTGRNSPELWRGSATVPLHQLRPFLFAIGAGCVSALAMAAAHNTRGLESLTLIALVPFFAVLDPRRFVSTWAQFALLIGLFEILTLSWINQIGEAYQWALLSTVLYHIGFFLLPAAVCWLLRRESLIGLGLMTLPASWVLAELLGQTILPWVWSPLLGQPLAEWSIVTQSTALLGPEFMTYLVVSVNVALSLWLRADSARVRTFGLVHAVGVLTFSCAWGWYWKQTPAAHVASVRAAVIQPCIPTEMKWDPAQRTRVLAQYDQLIDHTLPFHPQVIILPETAVSGFVRFDQELTDWVRRVVIRTRQPLIFRSLDRSDDASRFFNAAIMVTPRGVVSVYRKRRLVPIGEYLPAWTPLRFIVGRKLEHLRGPWPETFSPGTEPGRFEVGDQLTLAPLICLEDSFPDSIREGANLGADAAVVLIDTAWTSDPRPSRQHLQRARLVATAVGLPMIRCANSGVSCMINNQGQVVEALVNDEQPRTPSVGAHVFTSSLGQRPTHYRWTGDSLPLGLAGGFILAIFVLSRRVSSRSRSGVKRAIDDY